MKKRAGLLTQEIDQRFVQVSIMTSLLSFIKIQFSFSKISGICFIKLWPAGTPPILPAIAAQRRPTVSCPAPLDGNCAARREATLPTALNLLLGLCQIKLPGKPCVWVQHLLMRGRGCLDGRWTLQQMGSPLAVSRTNPCCSRHAVTSSSTRQLIAYLKGYHKRCLNTAPRLGLRKLCRCGGQRGAAKVPAENRAEFAGS